MSSDTVSLMAQKDAREYRDLSSSKIFNTRSSGVLLYSYVHHRGLIVSLKVGQTCPLDATRE